jgi:hypothetical protein
VHSEATSGNDASMQAREPAKEAAAAAAAEEQAEELARQEEEVLVAGFEEQNAWMDTYRCSAAARWAAS